MSKSHLTIDEVGYLTGIGRTTAYTYAGEGSLFGVPVLRVGRRMVVPLVPMAAVLGMTPEQVRQCVGSRESEPHEPGR
jgi:hypothetical protein